MAGSSRCGTERSTSHRIWSVGGQTFLYSYWTNLTSQYSFIHLSESITLIKILFDTFFPLYRMAPEVISLNDHWFGIKVLGFTSQDVRERGIFLTLDSKRIEMNFVILGDSSAAQAERAFQLDNLKINYHYQQITERYSYNTYIPIPKTLVPRVVSNNNFSQLFSNLNFAYSPEVAWQINRIASSCS